MPRKKKSDRWSSKDLAIKVARLADEKQAGKIVILDVAQAIQVADWFVLCNGLNRRHLGVIGEHVARELKKEGVYRMGGSPAPDENWVLLDFGPVVLHVFSPKARGYYDLDNLWGDCKRLRWRRVAPKKSSGATEVPLLEDEAADSPPAPSPDEDADSA